jgi:hypothetical protein
MSRKRSKRAARKSALAKQAEKLFSYENSDAPVIADTPYPTYGTEPVIVQTFTTYSVCEEPIPNFHKR